MTPTRRKSAQSATQDSVFTARVPYQAEIVNITFYGQDDEDGTFIIEHEINVDGRYIIYEETFNNNIDDPPRKEIARQFGPLWYHRRQLGRCHRISRGNYDGGSVQAVER